MTGKKTIIIRGSISDDDAQRKKHASLIVLRGEEIGRDFRLRGTGMVIGRGMSADITLPDDSASREHARIDRAGEDNPSFAITDLESTNGTFVNSRRVESAPLNDGDKVQIGDTILKFVLLDSVEASFHAEVRDRISYDQLTGLLTKESLYLAFERELERSLRYGHPLSVLMMDLDHFKSVNDTRGHLMGSHVLSEVGRLIQGAIRSVDVSARYGGEEFVSYLPETTAKGAVLVAERIRRAIEAHTFELDDVRVHVTISIGVATAPGHGRSTKELVGEADRALYRAKEGGRNQVRVA